MGHGGAALTCEEVLAPRDVGLGMWQMQRSCARVYVCARGYWCACPCLHMCVYVFIVCVCVCARARVFICMFLFQFLFCLFESVCVCLCLFVCCGWVG